MNIGKNLNVNATKQVTNDTVKTNRYLLNEPINDPVEIKRPSYRQAVKTVENMVNKFGDPRFSDYEIELFKSSYIRGNADLEPIERFVDKVDLSMLSYIDLATFRKQSKEENFYDKFEAKLNELKADNKEVCAFNHSEYLPEEEFSLDLKETKPFKRSTVYYNSSTMLPVAKKTSSNTEKPINGMYGIKNTIENYKKNSTHTEIVLNGGDDLVLSQIEKRDKQGNVIRTERMKPSKIDGIMDVEYVYPGGRVEPISKAFVDEKTGVTVVKKDMKAVDGTRTEFLYEDDPQGNRLLDYKITDKDGKVLMKNSKTFEVVSENTFRSSNNNDTYDITVSEKELTVKDVRRGFEAKIDFEKSCKGEKQELINLLKKVPGDELFAIVDSVNKLNGVSKEEVLSSHYKPLNKNIKIGDNLFVFLHELGHAKDGEHIKSGLRGIYDIIKKKEQYSGNNSIRKIWQEERARFNENATQIEREHISYFIQAKGHYQGEFGGLGELVAEANALTTTIPIKETADRAQVLQQHFPRTIAAIKDAMNFKNDVFAIEYYGT